MVPDISLHVRAKDFGSCPWVLALVDAGARRWVNASVQTRLLLPLDLDRELSPRARWRFRERGSGTHLRQGDLIQPV